jgi:hypothetical protein
MVFLLGPAMAASAADPTIRLISTLPDAPVLKVSEIAPRPQPRTRPPVPPLPPPPPPAAESLVVIMPDADGVLDESSVSSVEDDENPVNPFRVRYHPPLPMRDIHMGINSILVGAGPGQNAAVIDGKAYSPGDDLYGLRVSVISGEAVDLRHGNLILRLPVQDEPVTLRLPKSAATDGP